MNESPYENDDICENCAHLILCYTEHPCSTCIVILGEGIGNDNFEEVKDD